MTAIVWLLEPQQVCIAADTFSFFVEPGKKNDAKRVANFCTKLHPLPHIKLIVAGTGVRDVLFEWVFRIQEVVVARDVVMLHNLAESMLPEIAARYGVGEGFTSTIYHFGYSEEAKEFVGLAYRSTAGFVGQELEHGFGVKPPDGLDLETALAGEIRLPDTFVNLIIEQKRIDDARPFAERLGIGGEIQFLHLTETGCRFETSHRFPDYEEIIADLLRRCRNREA